MRSLRASLLSIFLATAAVQADPASHSEPIPAHPEVASCDVCLPTAVPRGPLQVLFQPGFQVGVDHQYTPLKDLHLDDHETANPAGERILSNTTQLHLTYNITPQAGFIVSIPYHNKDYRRLTSAGVEQGSVSGLGDIVVRGRYAPVAQFEADRTLLWTVEAGLKLPTGSSSLLREEGHHHAPAAGAPSGAGHHGRMYLAHEGHEHPDPDEGEHGEEPGGEHGGEHEHPPAAAPSAGDHSHSHNSAVGGHDLALGSGSVDGVIGTGVMFRQSSFFVSGGAQYLLRSTGTAGYRYGDLLTWRVAPGYLLINEEDQVVGLQLNLSGEHHDPNRVYDVKDHGYTDVIYVGPEALVQTDSLSAGLGVDFPVKYSSEGLTLAPDYRARVHLNWRF